MSNGGKNMNNSKDFIESEIKEYIYGQVDRKIDGRFACIENKI